MSRLSVTNLCVTFASGADRIRAVDNVSFDLSPGQRLAVVGESGSGKSALHLALLRLVPRPPACQISGQAMLGDQDLLRISQKQLQSVRGGKVAMIFQNPLSALNPFLTIGEQLIEPLVYHGGMAAKKAKSSAIELLNRVGVAEAAKRINDYPHQYSGGMRQRALIAMAIAGDPDIIIADEPTTALDASVRHQVLKILLDISRERGAALILITHDLAAASQVCERIHVMYAGRIVESGPKDQVLNSPRHPYTQALLKASLQQTVPPGELLPVIPGRPPDLRRIPAGCAFHPRCTYKENRCTSDVPASREVADRRQSTEDEQEWRIACHVDIDKLSATSSSAK